MASLSCHRNVNDINDQNDRLVFLQSVKRSWKQWKSRRDQRVSEPSYPVKIFKSELPRGAKWEIVQRCKYRWTPGHDSERPLACYSMKSERPLAFGLVGLANNVIAKRDCVPTRCQPHEARAQEKMPLNLSKGWFHHSKSSLVGPVNLVFGPTGEDFEQWI